MAASTTPILIRFPDELAERLTKAAPRGRRNGFVVDACRRALDELERPVRVPAPTAAGAIVDRVIAERSRVAADAFPAGRTRSQTAKRDVQPRPKG